MSAKPAAKAVAPAAAPPKEKKKGGKLKRALLYIAGAVLMVMIRLGFLFVLLGLLPSIVASFTDHTPRKDAFKTVLACNLAGMMPFLVSMVRRHGDFGTFQTIMTDPSVWLVVFSCAFGGFVLIFVCRYIAYLMLGITYQGELMVLENVQKKLLEEWGPQIKRKEN
jgi:hypothetical protein